MYRFSKKSQEKLSEGHKDLQLIVRASLINSDIDFGISEVLRTLEKQKENVRTGKSKTMNSKHLTGEAFDSYAYVDGDVSWDSKYYCYLAGVIMSTARTLFRQGLTEHIIRWGGNFDQDGDIMEQSFNDLCHFELYKVKQNG